jgi:hypothetical protein
LSKTDNPLSRTVEYESSCAPCSSMRQASILLAVWRCFLGAVVSSVSMASIAALKGSNRHDTPCLGLRSGGVADLRACRTVLRWTPCRAASARTDKPSTRASRLIRANKSTLDSIHAHPPLIPSTDGFNGEGGATDNRHKCPASHKVEPEVNRPAGAIQTCHSHTAFPGAQPLRAWRSRLLVSDPDVAELRRAALIVFDDVLAAALPSEAGLDPAVRTSTNWHLST